MEKVATRRAIASIVRDTIESKDLLVAEDRVVVAFSGGPDSTAAALLLRELGFTFTLCHIDHGARPESSSEAHRCAEIARQLEAPIEVIKVNVHPFNEAKARDERYRALELFARNSDATKVVTGHTLDDQAETVLMRLQRAGFALGMPYQRRIIVRPLLDIRKADTKKVCLAGEVEFIEDPSNHDLTATRNLIRQRVLADLDDSAAVMLAQLGAITAARVSETDSRLEEIEGSVMSVGDDGVRLNRNALNDLDEPLRRRVVRSAIARGSIDPSEQLVKDVAEKIATQTGSRLDLPGGWVAIAEPDDVVIGPAQIRPKKREGVIEVPGTTQLADWGLSVKVERVGPAAVSEARGDIAIVDAARISDELVVRPRKPGDRFRPLGMSGFKKLQDFLVDAKVPQSQRDEVPILVSGNDIVWLVGHRLDDRFRITEHTTQALKITAERLSVPISAVDPEVQGRRSPDRLH